ASAGVRLRSPGARLRLSSGARIVPCEPGDASAGTVIEGCVGGASAGAVTVPRGTVSMLTAGAPPSRAPDPSNANAEARPRPTVNSATGMVRSNIRIGLGFGGAAGMGHGAATRGPDLLGVFPQIARGAIRLSRRPAGTALVELGLVEPDVERAIDG